MEAVVINKLWIRPSDSEGNPLHVSFSREPEPHNVRLFKIGLETSSDWHRDKQVKEREQAGKTPEERAILIQTQFNINKLKQQYPGVQSFDKDFPFGENFFVDDVNSDNSTSMLDPKKACVGDVLDVVRDNDVVATLQISSSRWPCYKVNMKHSNTLGDMPIEEKVQAFCASTGSGGIFCRVLKEGNVQQYDKIVLKERIHPQWPLARVAQLCYGGNNRKNCLIEEFQGTEEELQQLLELKELAAFEWRDRLTVYVTKREEKKNQPTPPIPPQPIQPTQQTIDKNVQLDDNQNNKSNSALIIPPQLKNISVVLLPIVFLSVSYFVYKHKFS